jgi:hypothetical protein
MPFKIWDNHFGGYMRDPSGHVAEFARKLEADNAIFHFLRARTRQEDWLARLDVHHMESNLCYHLVVVHREHGAAELRPRLLPVLFDVPPNEWKLFADDGSEMTVGTVATSFRGEPATLVGLQPPHKMASEGKVFVTGTDGTRSRYGASVFGGTFQYLPPNTPLVASGLAWASTKWQPVKPFDVPQPQRLTLPPHWTTLPAGSVI